MVLTMPAKKLTRIRIDDYIGIRATLRRFMKESKTIEKRPERIARLRFIKELKREIDGYLISRGLIRLGQWKRR